MRLEPEQQAAGGYFRNADTKKERGLRIESEAANVIEQDQQGSEESFIEQKHSRGNSRVARPVALCSATPAQNQENGYKHKRQTARYSVREFDHRLGRHWQVSAVAERPVTAASCPRSGRAHVGAPGDDGDVVRDDEPRKVRERGWSYFENVCRKSRFGWRQLIPISS